MPKMPTPVHAGRQTTSPVSRICITLCHKYVYKLHSISCFLNLLRSCPWKKGTQYVISYLIHNIWTLISPLFKAVLGKQVTLREQKWPLKCCQPLDWRYHEKICHLALAPLEPVSPSSTASRVKSFSKFDRQYLCSPLIYGLYIYRIQRSEPLIEVYQKSRGWQHFKGHFCSLKVISFT